MTTTDSRPTAAVKVAVTSLLIAAGAMSVIALIFYIRAEANLEWYEWADALGLVTFLAVFGGVGALVALHRPHNIVGWLCLAFSLVWATWSAADALLIYDELHPGTLENPGLIAALTHPLWVPGVGIIGLLLLVFPDGRVTSPRWPWVLWGLLVVMAMLTFTAFFLPGVVQDRTVENPLGIEAFEVFDSGPIGVALVLLLILGIGLSALSVVFRYRKADTVERMQLKWLMAAAMVSAVSYGLVFVVGDMPVQLIFSLIPIAIWFAMRRQGLYEIDRLISRTVAYAVVVGILGLVYLGMVFVLQDALPGDDSLAVAASTLLAAAIFNPLRKSVLARVDRFFNRSHYDAERVVEGFTEGLRNETDAERIVHGWLGVVSETMAPTSVGVWTR
jgi:hypothetical protein